MFSLLAPAGSAQSGGAAVSGTRPASDVQQPTSYTAQAWTVRDGLPVNSVSGMVQTPDGYLWLATFDGLVRFDGVRFTVYNAANTPGMPSSRLSNIQAGLGNSFWLVTEQQHLLRFESGRIRRFVLAYRDYQPRVVADGDSVLWVLPETGLLRERGDALVPYASDVIGPVPVRALLRARTGALWVADSAGVWRFGAGRPQRYAVRAAGPPGVERLAEGPDGAVWAFGSGVARFAGGAFQTVVPPGGAWGPVAQLAAVPGGPDLILGGLDFMTTHLVRLRASGPGTSGSWTPWPYRAPLAVEGVAFAVCPDHALWATNRGRLYRDGRLVLDTGLSRNALFCDREGNVWLATRGQGLHRFRPASLQTVGDAPEAPALNLYGVFEDRTGAVWAGGVDGALRRYRGGRPLALRVPRIDRSSTAVFLETAAGALWMGRYRCDPDQRTPDGDCARFTLEAALPYGIRAILQTRNGTLWFGTEWGLYRLRDGAWTTFTTADGLPSSFVRYLLEARDGALWLATNGGGVVRVRETPDGRQTFEAFTTANGLPSDNVRALYEDARGALWIATEDRGLARRDPTTGRIVAIRQADGLYDDALHAILEDAFGRLWMSTNRGLFWVPRAELDAFAQGRVPRVHATFYTERDGMRNREANGGYQNAALKASDGRLWFATQDGAVVVDPRHLGPDLPVPPVVIEDLTTADGRVVVVDGGTPVALAPTERSFAVRYTAPTFVDPERLRFRYRLEGFDPDWVTVEGRREAIYTNVPPGTYTLRVASASGGGGAWNEAGAPLTVHVAPFFYETGWFLALCLLAGIAGLGLASHARARALRRRATTLSTVVEERTRELRAAKDRTDAQADQLRALDRAKSRFFADISHEFRTPLTLTLGPIQDVLDDRHGAVDARARGQLDLALRNGRRLHRLTNQLLDLARLESGHFAVDLRPGDLADYLRTLAGPFAAAAERAGVAFALDVPAARVPVRFDPDHLDKVFANLLSNAVKFTPAGGAVTLALTLDGGQAVAAVRDTGPGIAPDHLPHVFDRFFQGQKSEMQPGTGIGLALAREIAELHGAPISVASVPGEGATFTVTLPLDPAVPAVPDTAAAATVGASGRRLHSAEPHGDGATTDALADDGPPEDPHGDDLTTVLVVDDNPDIRAYLRHHLEGRYRVAEAADGEAALAAVRERLPDLVVSDVMMPRLDGFGLLAALRADPETDFLPVILLTARAGAEDRLAGLGLGADDYVTKPFQARELVARVDNLIARQRHLRERFAGARLPDGSRVPDEPCDAVEPVAADAADAAFLDGVREAVAQCLGDEDFGVDALAEAVGQSRSTLYRRVVALTGESPSALLLRMRVDHAAALLRARAGTVSEVAYAAGFKSVSHFSARFRQHAGQTPTAYLAAHASSAAAPA